MTEGERTVWLVAIGRANGSEFDFDGMRWRNDG